MNNAMKAIKRKLRFRTELGASTAGILTAECLWDIPIDELNSLTIKLREEASEVEDDGYLEELSGSKVETDAKLRFQVAEEIIICRVAEVKSRNKAAENKVKRDKLLAIIASKEAQELEGTDIEALREMADSLV